MDERNLNRDAAPLGAARDESLGGGVNRPSTAGLGGTGTDRAAMGGAAGSTGVGDTAYATGGTGTDRTGGFAGSTASTAGGGAGTANTPSFSGGPADIGVSRDSGMSASSGGMSGSSGGQSGSSGGQDAKQMLKDRAAEVGGRLEDRANTAMERAAGGLQTAADRIDRLADQQGGGSGMRARAGEMAHGAADTLETAAGYLRENDVQKLQEDLGRMVRERPLQTLLMAVAAGWVVGKVLR